MLMTIAGLYLLVKYWRGWRHDQAFKLFTCVFLLAWIPILVSLVDAVRPQSTIGVSVSHLRFAFSGIFILHVLSTPAAHRRFLTLCAWLLLFWVVDGWCRRPSDAICSVLRYPPAGRINALFGDQGLV